MTTITRLTAATATDTTTLSPDTVVVETRPRKPWEFTQEELRSRFKAMLASRELEGTLYLHETRGHWWSPLTGWPHAPTGFLASRDNVLELGHTHWHPCWVTTAELRDFFALIGGEFGFPGEWAELPDLNRRNA